MTLKTNAKNYIVTGLRFLGTHPLVAGVFALLSIFAIAFTLYGYVKDRDGEKQTTIQVNDLGEKIDEVRHVVSGQQQSSHELTDW